MPFPAEYKPQELTPTQQPLAQAQTNEWLVPSPSRQQWGCRVFLYDMLCALGPYERFKALTVVLLWIVFAVNGRLHNVYATVPPPAAPSATLSESEAHWLPSIVFNMPWIYRMRWAAVAILFTTYWLEMMAGIARMRLVD